MDKVTQLKALAVKLGCANSVSAVPGDTVGEVINFINTNYPIPTPPKTAGDYTLSVSVTEEAITYSWKKTL